MLTTEHSNQHLSVTRAPRIPSKHVGGGLRNTRDKRKSGANPVRSRHCNWRDALPLVSLQMRDATRKPLSTQCGWEGGEPSLSAMSQEACLRCILAALRGTSEADLPVNWAWLIKLTRCPFNTPRPPSADGAFAVFSKANPPAPPREIPNPPHPNGWAGRCDAEVFIGNSQERLGGRTWEN